MSALESNLSSAKYGYDFVVATTQDSINATIKHYLDSLDQPATYIIFKRDRKTKTNIQVPFDEFKKESGVNPFKIPAKADAEDPDVKALEDARFVAGIKITLGLPENFKDPRTLPPTINLQEGASSVLYNMYCANIEICELSYSVDGPSWNALSQNDTPDKAWMFQSKVDLRLESAEFSELPTEVRNSVKNLGKDAFSVQQLLFDLSNAALETVPTIDGLDPTSNASTFLTKYFVNSYFGHMKEKGQPILNYVVVHKDTTADSTFKPTDLNFHVGPLIGKALPQGLSTLNYLCATGDHKLPPPVDFTWDWVDVDDAKQYNGIISINRNTFAQYLLDELMHTVRKDCFDPKVSAVWDSPNVKVDVWNGGPALDSDIVRKIEPSGANIININYKKRAQQGVGWKDATANLELEQEYSKKVTIAGNKVTIVSYQKIWLYIRALTIDQGSNITDVTATHIYELAVDEEGKLVMKKEAKPVVDHSHTDQASIFGKALTNIDDVFKDFAGRKFTNTDIQTETVRAFQDFVFPGGQVFAFKGFNFSDYQDLVANITYADPQSPK